MVSQLKGNAMNRFVSRLKEPSTWAGLSALAMLFGVPVPPGLPEAIGTIVTAGAAVAAVVLPEKKA
jgi:hypothetical protein